ncbi:MAG: hypothetical protein CMP10_04200 [Zetaproteobacteria bacterium]|nr:hypothetical protein [Pseudobdellovibrionaceae bacterium]|tara:strand:- start:909 stop:2003 length:1095 start_codon:yes stop_codon:yes gene_type:complete
MPVIVPESVDWDRVKRLVILNLVFISVIGLGLLLYKALLLSICFGLLVCYLTDPLVDFLTLRLKGQRALAAFCVVLLGAAIVAFLFGFLLPLIYREIFSIIKMLPRAFGFLAEWVAPYRDLALQSGFFGVGTIDAIISEFNIWEQLSVQLRLGVEKVWSNTPSLLSGAINLALVPVLVFFVHADYDHLKSVVSSLIPEDLWEPMNFGWQSIDRTLKSVLKGQITVAVILACLYMMALGSIGLSAGVAIGAIAGLCRVIPYLDVLVGLSLSLVVIITKNSGIGQLIEVCGVFLVVQAIDGMFITPRVIGDKAGLHPGVVIISVIALGDWFGFFGVLVAIPLVATVKVLLEIMIPYYRASSLFTRK